MGTGKGGRGGKGVGNLVGMGMGGTNVGGLMVKGGRNVGRGTGGGMHHQVR